MPNLADSGIRDHFLIKLTRVEKANYGELSEWEETFIQSLRESFDLREQEADLGLTQWNPSVKQWNQLGEIYRRLTGG